MRRCKILGALAMVILLAIASRTGAVEPPARFGPRAQRPPRKVVVGTALFGPYGEYPGLETRLSQLGELIDQMAAEASRQHEGRGLDLAVLPESVVNNTRGKALDRAVPLKGPVEKALGAMARKHRTYLLAPFDLLEEGPKGRFASNAAVLIDRKGSVAGVYRKAHPVAYVNSDVLEDGITPGREFPVFECDFGKLGVQICWDIQFSDGWDELARRGAEIVAWPSASPATLLPSARAALHRYYVVSSTWRDNSTVYEPTGIVAAQVRTPGRVLVHEIDLSYAILGWSGFLRDGEALREKFGDRVGYHYSNREDCGLFWSNDPASSIADMIRSIGGEELDAQVERNRRLQENAVKDEGTGLRLRMRKPADRGVVEQTSVGPRVTLNSETGIGSAELEPGAGGWPGCVSVRLKLRGLEALRLSGGKASLQIQVPSSPGQPARVTRFRADGAEEPLGNDEIRSLALAAFDAEGHRASTPLAPGGWFAFRIPATLLTSDSNRILLEWVDFHR